MVLAGLVVVAAVLLGWLLGGRLRRLAGLPLRGLWLLAGAGLALVGGAAAAVAAGSAAAYVAGSLLATLLTVTFLARNRALYGVPLVTAGLALNAVVAVLNGGMPVSPGAAGAAGLSGQQIADIAAGVDPRHVLAGPATVLDLLADRIPLRLPLFPEVLSAGDVLVAAGLGLLVVTAMTGVASPSTSPLRRAGRAA